ncbi:6-phosphogluconate phosphatase [Nymphon striatum]|nr:6-phosphogluconate phosphatase [Nymphon striatum]
MSLPSKMWILYSNTMLVRHQQPLPLYDKSCEFHRSVQVSCLRLCARTSNHYRHPAPEPLHPSGEWKLRCICSNGPQNKMQKMLGRVGLHDKFRPYIFSAKDFNPPKHKPEPDIIFKALKEFEMQPQQAIVVEDSVHGIGAARAAGTRIVGFTGATHTYDTHADELIDAGAETVISRLSELPAIIDAFSSWDGIN